MFQGWRTSLPPPLYFNKPLLYEGSPAMDF